MSAVHLLLLPKLPLPPVSKRALYPIATSYLPAVKPIANMARDGGPLTTISKGWGPAILIFTAAGLCPHPNCTPIPTIVRILPTFRLVRLVGVQWSHRHTEYVKQLVGHLRVIQ